MTHQEYMLALMEVMDANDCDEEQAQSIMGDVTVSYDTEGTANYVVSIASLPTVDVSEEAQAMMVELTALSARHDAEDANKPLSQDAMDDLKDIADNTKQQKENKMEFTKEQLKAIKALQAAEKSPAWNRVSAYVIIAPGACNTTPTGFYSKSIGKIKVIHPADGMGILKVFAWDCSGNNGLQIGQASGCGYDKLSAAMEGLKFDDIVFTDHPKNWEMQLREAGYTIVQAI